MSMDLTPNLKLVISGQGGSSHCDGTALFDVDTNFELIDAAFGAIAAGAKWFTAAGAPTTLPKQANDDLYLNESNYDVWQLQSGTWTRIGTLVGGSSTPSFSALTSGANTDAAMVVGTGATLAAEDDGVINATEINGVPITGTPGLGKIPIGQGDGTAVFADPLVQGLNAELSDASATNPVLISGKGDDGKQHDVATDNSGQVKVLVENSVAVTGPLTDTQLRTTAVPVSVSALPLPTGAALETGGNLAAIKADTDKIPSQGQALAAASLPVVLPALQVTALTPPAAITNFANETGGNLAAIKTDADTLAGTVSAGKVAISVASLPLPTGAALETGGNLAAIKADTDKIPAQGQALAAASLPVVLTALQVTALTPPAALTNFANETGGNLAAIKADTDKIPSQGQALAAGSLPVVLPALQVTALTPPAAITNFANETGGNLAAIKTDADTLAGTVSGAKVAVRAASGDLADGSLATLGAKADAKSTATDTTAVSIMSVLKEISAMEQAPASTPVTNVGTFAVQEATLDGCVSGGKLQVKTAAVGDVQVEVVDAAGHVLPAGDVVGRAIYERITDGTNGPVAVKPAGTGAQSSDPAIVITESPNSGLPATVQHIGAAGVGSQASLSSGNFGANVTAGNSIVVVVAVGNAGTIKVTDTLGNKYTQAVLQANGSTFSVAIFYATNILGGTNAVTVTPSASVSCCIEAYEVLGLLGVGGGGSSTANSSANQQNAIDSISIASSSGSSVSPTSNALDTLYPNEIAFGGIAIGTADQTPTAFAPWSKDADLVVTSTPSGLFGLHSFSQPLGDAANGIALSATITSEPWACVACAFKPLLTGISGNVSIKGLVVASAPNYGAATLQQVSLDITGAVRMNPTGQTGSFKTYHNSNPAAGATTSWTVPAGKKWRVASIFVQFTTSATAGTRQIVVEPFDVSSNFLAVIAAAATQAASLTQNYTFAPSLADAIAGTAVKTGFPGIVLGPGAFITITATGLVVTDQLKIPTITVEEYND